MLSSTGLFTLIIKFNSKGKFRTKTAIQQFSFNPLSLKKEFLEAWRSDFILPLGGGGKTIKIDLPKNP